MLLFFCSHCLSITVTVANIIVFSIYLHSLVLPCQPNPNVVGAVMCLASGEMFTLSPTLTSKIAL